MITMLDVKLYVLVEVTRLWPAAPGPLNNRKTDASKSRLRSVWRVPKLLGYQRTKLGNPYIYTFFLSNIAKANGCRLISIEL